MDLSQQIEITVLVRPRSSGGQAPAQTVSDLIHQGTRLPEKCPYLSRADFAAQRGAHPDDLAKIEAFAREHDLAVVQSSLRRRTVKLSGRIGDLMEAFKLKLKRCKIGDQAFRRRQGAISAPAELSEIIAGVFGFDNRPVAIPYYQRLDEPRAISMSVRDVAKHYQFPAGLDGTGQCIALIELNDIDEDEDVTGVGYNEEHLEMYFDQLGLPMPQITDIRVDGGINMPDESEHDHEVMLNIQVAGTVAPGARIAVYFAPNTYRGFLDAVNEAVHDEINQPSVISISWGGPEDLSWVGTEDGTSEEFEEFRDNLNQVLREAGDLGVTICCVSGNYGSSGVHPTAWHGTPHVGFPASSPFVLTCGGTAMFESELHIREEVWNTGRSSTGGGVSNIFARPAYQARRKIPESPAGKPGRGVPDVAGYAAGYQVITGEDEGEVINGTSAVAPLWAGLIALINQRLASLGKPPAGFINPLLYQAASSRCLFKNITKGSNDIEGLGQYSARRGWDACTGLGSPDGEKVMQALGG